MTVSQDIINLFDRFTHGGMDRRSFMQRLTQLAGGTAAAIGVALGAREQLRPCRDRRRR